jgi:hypothetical protein
MRFSHLLQPPHLLLPNCLGMDVSAY